MRSISASSCAISFRACGESTVLIFSAPGASAPSVAATRAAVIDRSARCVFIGARVPVRGQILDARVQPHRFSTVTLFLSSIFSALPDAARAFGRQAPQRNQQDYE